MYTTALRAALHYAELSYSVLPLKVGAKTPATMHGVKNATRDVSRIRDWWSCEPLLNVGLCTSDLIAVDVDSPEADWFKTKHGLLFEAAGAVQRTRRGGFHFLFRLPPDKAYRPSTGLIAPGIDVKAGPGGYIVVWPSVVERRGYKWLKPLCAKDELPLPPDWLTAELDRIEARRSNGVAYSPAADATNCDSKIPPIIAEGARNTTLFAIATKLRRIGLMPTEAASALLELNRRRCRPPLPEAEVIRIVESASRYPVPEIKPPRIFRFDELMMEQNHERETE